MSETSGIDGLLEKVSSYEGEADLELIRRAYQFAEQSHRDQVRLSGEDFISHPFGVAEILVELHMDDSALAAALLHDVVEDTETTLDAIEKDFGSEVALLIDGVTKLTKIEFKTREEKQAENFRKMIMAMSKDLRIIIIKLADRLHNMRTLCYLDKQKQLQKAMETVEIYAPLAHRLGIHSVKWELEDLSFQYLYPRRYREIQEMVAQRRTAREEFIDEAISLIRERAENEGIEADISGRAKHFYSIYQKMVKRGKEFNEIYDLIAIRILVDSNDSCYRALGLIHEMWPAIPGRFKDYIGNPKENGYQSLHTTVIGPKGRPLEIQIRTREMHIIAEYGVAAHWKYKDDTETRERKDNRWLKQIIEWQQDVKDPEEFLETLKLDLYEEEVFVFTPRGDVQALPVGSSPIDFAYAVHTDVGHRCVGAKVNGKIVTLEYQLQNGDQVEILTAKNGTPSRDWLNMVKTSRARSKIRAWFGREDREGAQHIGRDMVSKSLQRQGLPVQKLINSEVMRTAAEALHFPSVEEMMTAVGSGRLSPTQVMTKVINEIKHSEASAGEVSEDELRIRLPKVRRRERSSEIGVAVDGIDDVLIRLARCCNPVPGDEIVGYISLGHGVTIHQASCPNMKSLGKSPERLVGVHWKDSGKQRYEVAIQVEALDRTKLLRDITTVLSETDSGANILSANVSISKNVAINRFLIELSDISRLDGLLERIMKVETVIDAYRLSPTARQR